MKKLVHSDQNRNIMKLKQLMPSHLALKVSMILALFVCFTQSSQAQIRKYQKVQKLGTGTYNFHGEEEELEDLDLDKNKGHYIVYSDRSENSTFGDAYAQKRNPAQPFLKPFFVINEKNDYVELVTYDPALLGKPDGMASMFYSGKYTFSDSKSAEYVGWIHKNRLLHYSQAQTSHLNYRPVRYVLGIKKLNTLFNVEKFVVDNEVKLFLDPEFKRESDKKLQLNQIVYLFKENERQTSVLVSNKSQISDADSADRIMGWISKDLINYIGQHQVFSTDSLDSIVFYEPYYFSQKGVLNRKEIASSIIFNTEKNVAKDVRKEDTVDVMVPTSVWDHSLNTLTNVEGDELLISKIEEIEKQSKDINFHFIFDSGDDAKLKQIKLMASLQRIWLLYAENEDYSEYNFTFSTSSYGSNEFYLYRQTTSFPEWIEYINKVLLSDPTAYKTMVNDIGIERCFNFALASSDTIDFSTNIIMVSGMKAFTRMSARTKSDLTKKLAQASSRLIFFQLANSSEDVYQEFILQSKDLLGRVALEYADFIKSFTVDNHLVKEKNIFKSIPSDDNLYVFDSPESSNYQGGIGFSKMNSELVPTSVDMVLDSVIAHTLKTNKIYLQSLDEYNSKLGFLRSRPSKYIDKIVDQDSTYQDQITLLPRNSLDESFNRYEQVVVGENELVTAYLLSESELQILIDNYKSLVPLFSGEVTNKERKFVYGIYQENIKNLNELFLNEVLSSKSTVADLMFIKSGLPVANQVLHDVKIKNVVKRRKLNHAEFQSLYLNLRKKIDELEVIYADDQEMTTDYDATTRYYFIPVEKLF
ncbi:MAG: type VI secretion system protein TssR [Crocinitomicaceae bacterium]|nr:type VI secretion system protein TssR [Crocinitomicaceae bacterium]